MLMLGLKGLRSEEKVDNNNYTVNSLLDMDTFGAGTQCPSKTDVRLIESNKGSKERLGPTLGVSTCFIEVYVSIKRESTVKLKGFFLIHECYRL